MAGLTYRAGKWFANRKAARRGIPLLWAFAVAEALAATHRHFRSVDPDVRRRTVALARKSKGRLSNLTPHEKQELRGLVAQMDLMALGRELAAVASPVGIPGLKKRR